LQNKNNAQQSRRMDSPALRRQGSTDEDRSQPNIKKQALTT